MSLRETMMREGVKAVKADSRLDFASELGLPDAADANKIETLS